MLIIYPARITSIGKLWWSISFSARKTTTERLEFRDGLRSLRNGNPVREQNSLTNIALSNIAQDSIIKITKTGGQFNHLITYFGCHADTGDIIEDHWHPEKNCHLLLLEANSLQQPTGNSNEFTNIGFHKYRKVCAGISLVDLWVAIVKNQNLEPFSIWNSLMCNWISRLRNWRFFRFFFFKFFLVKEHLSKLFLALAQCISQNFECLQRYWEVFVVKY